MKPHLITAAALAGIISASLAGPARALDEHDSYRPFGAGPLTCGNFTRAVDGLDPREKDSPKLTFTNYKRFVNGWLTAADRFIPGLNDATGGRDADWFTGVLVNHCRANPSLTIADALEQIINIRFPRLFAEKAPPLTHRSTATNNMLDKPPADETTEKAAAAVAPPKLSTLPDNPLITAPAMAASSSNVDPDIFPTRDVNVDCYNVVSGNHNSDAARSSINYCIDIVQVAYDSAVYLWNIVSGEDRKYCLNDSRTMLNYGYYIRLNECLKVREKLADMKSIHHFDAR
jgi:hypothetical protein